MDRRELYRKVWAKSAVQLAKEFGISDVAIAKLCKKHHVPKPPLGYWARIEHGQKVPRPPLPEVEEERLNVVCFQPMESHPIDDHEALVKIDAEEDANSKIVVAEKLFEPHILVERTQKSLSSAAVDERGIVRPKAKQCLDVAVGKANIDRAMQIMDALVKAMEARGYSVAVVDREESRDTLVTVLDERLQIGLIEKTDCKQRPPTPEQLERRARNGYSYDPVVYDYTPSGKLKLSILTGGYDSLRRNWTDLVHRRIEDCLNKFVAALIRVAAREKADRLESERRDREWKDEQRRREEEARRIAEEKVRREDLEAKSAAWRKSHQLRDYIDALENAAIQRLGVVTPDSGLGRWLAWAKNYADSIDPLQSVFRQMTEGQPRDAGEVSGQ